MSQLVLAIEPDLRQAAIVKRIVKEKALADVVVVDSRDAAIEAMRTSMPDVLLLSALLSPRDEDELMTHLRTLDHAGHIQTHTIPQLASSLGPGEERASRGLLSAFRRKKEATQVEGCDPDLFGDEIRLYLQQAAEKRQQLQSMPQRAPVRRADPAAAGAESSETAAETEEAAAPDSAWASPFEWKPAGSSSSRKSRAREQAPAPPPAPTPTPTPEPVVASAPIVDTPSVIKPAADEPLIAAAAPVEAPAAPPPPIVETPIAAKIVDAPIAAEIVNPPIAARSVDPPIAARIVEPLVSEPVAAQPPTATRSLVAERVGQLVEPVAAKKPAKAAEPARPKPVADRPAKLTGSQLRDLIRRQAASDNGDGLGPLARWARSDAPRAVKSAAVTGDDVRSLLSSLAVPPAVASVTYPSGVRLRRVRVPVSPEHEATQASA